MLKRKKQYTREDDILSKRNVYMNRNWIRRGIIVVVFIASLLIFSIVLNQGNTDITMEMAPASLPVASILIEDQKVNEMHGYVRRMDAASIRDSLTPIGEHREVAFQIDMYGQELEELRFEVRSVDGERLVEDTRVTDYTRDGNTITADVNLKDLISENVEYNFILILTLGDGRDVFYYTRVIQNNDTVTAEKLKFVLDFHNKTFDKETAKDLAIYLEPSSEGDNSNFGNVDIHCNLNQVSWGNMKVEEIEAPSVTICELSANLASVRLESIVQVKEGKITNTYRVEEFYRVRYTKDRFYLLNYNRTMEEIFPMEKSSFANNKIVLGIQSEAIQMQESDGGNIMAFENAGRVYCYDVIENKLAQLHAFFDEEHFDVRTYYDRSEIKILDVEENGNVSFMVYGYMNRGTHEGEVGVEVFYYNHLLNTIEEQIFIEYDKSPQILMADIGKIAYVNRNNDLFVLLEGSIYKINMGGKSSEVIICGLNEDSFYVSGSNQMVVWQEEKDAAGEKKLTLMNLNTEEITTIQAGAGEYCKAVGFMNEDVIYGLANIEDVSEDQFGTNVFPMKKLLIQSENGVVQKRYESEDIYIMAGEIKGNQLNLTRAKGIRKESMEAEEEGKQTLMPLELTPTTDDQITSNVVAEEGTNKIVEVVTDLYETIQQIELKKEIEAKSIQFLTPKEVMYEGGRNLALENEKEQVERYLVYTKGKLSSIYSDAGKAVLYAYEQVGTVLDEAGNLVYRRGELAARNQIMAIKEAEATKERNSLAVCLNTILQLEGVSRNTEYMLEQGENAYGILENVLKDYQILNLSGCTLDAMLYYVNQDIPVLSIKEDGTAVLIIGFNQQNIVLMDPENGKIYKKGMNDSREMFKENGNRFMTYIREKENG